LALLVHDERHQLATENGFGRVGWHIFRHNYRSWLSGADTPIDVQQQLMRHAQILTTQQYGAPPMEPAPGEQQCREKLLPFRKAAE